jgi:hypothetical protein
MVGVVPAMEAFTTGGKDEILGQVVGAVEVNDPTAGS